MQFVKLKYVFKCKSSVTCTHGGGFLDFGCVSSASKISEYSFNLPSLNTKSSEAVVMQAIQETAPIVSRLS